MKRESFPLSWPDGFSRTKADARTRSRFGYKSSGQVPFDGAYRFLMDELARLGAANSVVTSDLPTRRDGVPYSPGHRVSDPGVAIWFLLPDDNGTLRERTFACDRWLTHAENMYAIAMSIEAMRGLERWGMADVVQRTFAGFNALPSGDGSEGAQPQPAPPKKRSWREVLGEAGPWPELDADELLVLAKGRHRKLVQLHHPDRGGDVARAAELNVALADAHRELTS